MAGNVAFYDSVKFVKTDESIKLVIAENDMPSLFMNLLNGVATIIKNPWRPSKMGETYWYVNIYGKVDYTTYDTASDTDRLRLMVRNCYQTVEEAEEHVDYWKHVYEDMTEFNPFRKRR